MTIDDVLKLVNAGFTAEQIGQMMRAEAPAQPSSEPEAAPAAAADPEPEQPKEPEPDIYKQLSDKIDAKFAEMVDAFKMPAVPSIGDIKPLGLDDIIKNFFKEE